ncbi:MAG: two component, sigma54 specific, transcriptional regulator, Fis family [Myxococcaceae bacterium]|nr:two component, sigma54 specific, transcriptional regulator, Fis family [Myxococcaceae bacterium]
MHSNTEADSVIIVDDDPAILRLVQRILGAAGIAARAFESASDALAAMETSDIHPELVLTDLHLGATSGMNLLTRVRASWPDAAVVLMTGGATVSSAVEAMRLGAYDYLVKPFTPPDALLSTVQRALERQRLVVRNRQLEREVGALRSEGMIGDSPALRHVFSLIDAVAPADTTVLVLGESGTGKELIARTIHNCSPRKGRPFLAINCGALAESVLDSELFGHVRGAFTGAIASRKGLFEAASGGTLFLDEVGELPASLQVKLLRVLQEREVRPVGSNEVRPVDIRVVAATNRDLRSAVRERTFREDLYYRLNVVSIESPPLRKRRQDIAPLVHHFLRKHALRLGKPVKAIDPMALEALVQRAWPGNVRELENAVERSVILARGDTITAEGVMVAGDSIAPPSLSCAPTTSLPFPEAVRQFERAYVASAIAQADGNLAEAARIAGVDRSNFRRMAKRHVLVPPSEPPSARPGR